MGSSFKCLHGHHLSLGPAVEARLMPLIYEDVCSRGCGGEEKPLGSPLGET